MPAKRCFQFVTVISIVQECNQVATHGKLFEWVGPRVKVWVSVRVIVKVRFRVKFRVEVRSKVSRN